MSREWPVTTLNCSNSKCGEGNCELERPFSGGTERAEELLEWIEERFMLYRGTWTDDTDLHATEAKTFTRKEVIDQYLEHKKKKNALR